MTSVLGVECYEAVCGTSIEDAAKEVAGKTCYLIFNDSVIKVQAHWTVGDIVRAYFRQRKDSGR